MGDNSCIDITYETPQKLLIGKRVVKNNSESYQINTVKHVKTNKILSVLHIAVQCPPLVSKLKSMFILLSKLFQ